MIKNINCNIDRLDHNIHGQRLTFFRETVQKISETVRSTDNKNTKLSFKVVYYYSDNLEEHCKPGFKKKGELLMVNSRILNVKLDIKIVRYISPKVCAIRTLYIKFPARSSECHYGRL